MLVIVEIYPPTITFMILLILSSKLNEKSIIKGIRFSTPILSQSHPFILLGANEFIIIIFWRNT